MAFNLSSNPFALLNVSPRATKAEIASAYQSAILDGDADEAVLDRALATLTSAKGRLRAEVAFLPAATPAEVRTILKKIRSDEATSELAKAPLDRANLVAVELVGRASPALLDNLLRALTEIDPGDVCRDINAARQVAQVGPAQRQDVENAIAGLIADHAAGAAEALIRTPDHSAIAEALVKAGLANDTHRAFLTHFVPTYSKLTTHELARLRAAIEAEEDALRAEPTMFHAQAAVKLLHQWDHLRQPVQLWDEAHGIDEPLSKELGTRLRDLCIWLANERDAYEIALMISSGLREAFGELAGMRDLFDDDVSALKDLSAKAEARRKLAPLLAILAEMRADPRRTAANMGQWLGYVGSADHGKLGTAFDNAIADLGEGVDLVTPAFAIRNLALELHNEFDESAAAQRLTEWLLEYRSRFADDVVERLLEDQATLSRLLLQRELTPALEQKRYSEAERLIALLLTVTHDVEERGVLLGISRTVSERKSKQMTSRIGWSIAAALLLFWMLAQNSNSTTEPYGADTTTEIAAASTESMDEAAAALSEPTTDATEPAPDDTSAQSADPVGLYVDEGTEQMPSVGIGQELSRPQLRYCMRQKERITTAQTKIDNTSPSQITGFNAAVDDYNSRCSNFRYAESDMAVVRSDIASEPAVLANDADKMVRSW